MLIRVCWDNVDENVCAITVCHVLLLYIYIFMNFVKINITLTNAHHPELEVAT